MKPKYSLNFGRRRRPKGSYKVKSAPPVLGPAGIEALRASIYAAGRRAVAESDIEAELESHREPRIRQSRPKLPAPEILFDIRSLYHELLKAKKSAESVKRLPRKSREAKLKGLMRQINLIQATISTRMDVINRARQTKGRAPITPELVARFMDKRFPRENGKSQSEKE